MEPLMNRPHFPRWVVDVAAVIVAGLALGLAASRAWVSEAPVPRQEPVATGVSLPSRKPAERSVLPGPGPAPAANPHGKRALLIGVTRYDNLSKGYHLAGPANDIRLMRRLLQERYGFPANGIVSLTEDQGSPTRRPTRENIEREFRRLADQAREGDQVVVLLAGHGSRQPESNPADPVQPEPDGIDEIFLPADVSEWRGYPERVPKAIVDNEIGAWLRAITARRAYVWAIFDCCHSGTMTRGTEVVRELPPGILVPREELDRARQRAARRRPEYSRGGPPAKPVAFLPRQPSDDLVATYACRSDESTPESFQPPGSPAAEAHGLLTYSLVDILLRSGESRSSLTYRELVRRLQARYAGRPQGSPTPLVEGRGQDRIVLGTEEPTRSPLVLTREGGQYKVNAGDLYGLTPGSILTVESPAGADGRRKLVGHVRVRTTRPFDATVESCAYEGTPLAIYLPPLSTCRPVYLDFGLRRFKVAIQAPKAESGARQRIQEAVRSLAEARGGIVELIDDPRQADWIVRLDQGQVELVEASGNRPPFPLPPDNPALGEMLRSSLEKVYRARNLFGLAGRFEGERYRDSPAVDIAAPRSDRSRNGIMARHLSVRSVGFGITVLVGSYLLLESSSSARKSL
jgi:hypothetical protein